MYKIRLAAKSKSIAKIGPIPMKDYIVGQKYQVWYEVENIGGNPFPGGVLQVQITWPNGQIVAQPFTIKPLAPSKSDRTQIIVTHALARGFALFHALPITANDGKKVEMYITPTQKFRPPHQKVLIYHIHSIYAKPKEEITGYWAMWISAVSLIILVATSLIQFILWLAQFSY